jgi:hypothetical protein
MVILERLANSNLQAQSGPSLRNDEAVCEEQRCGNFHTNNARKIFASHLAALGNIPGRIRDG